MTRNLKQKTITGLVWSFIDSFSNLGIQFIVGIILAKILSPREFGLVGMILIFTAIAQTIIDSGFSQALIRKKDCTQVDYSTVFYFNAVIGIIFTVLIFFAAPVFSRFFKEPELVKMVQALSVVVFISSVSIIQRTILTKRIDFRLQTRISVIASVGSGVLAIWMAFNGYGVWSLVAQHLSKQTLNTILLWVWNRWFPVFDFSLKSFAGLFGFGSKLLISGLIESVYQNLYFIVIGKYFSATELGYYSRADQFNSLPSKNITGVIQRVSYPVLVDMQTDLPRLRENYQKLIRSTTFITFVLMVGMAATAKPLILALIGEIWLPSVIYLQMLCFVGMFYPLHALNLNMLQVMGRSDLFLKLEIIKKVFAVPVIIVGIFYGIKIMLIGMIINALIAFYLNSYYSGQLIGYSFFQQVKDIIPSLIVALTMGIPVFAIGFVLALPPAIVLTVQIISGGVIVFVIGELIRQKDYTYIKNILLGKYKSYTGR